MEKEALAWLQVETGFAIEPVGFIESDDGLFGASPDGLINGYPAEIKCPKPSTHIQWLLEGGLPKDHIAQVHMQMAISEKDKCYFMSYTPDCRPLIIEAVWNDYTESLVHQMDKYRKEFIDAFKSITGKDYAEV